VTGDRRARQSGYAPPRRHRHVAGVGVAQHLGHLGGRCRRGRRTSGATHGALSASSCWCRPRRRCRPARGSLRRCPPAPRSCPTSTVPLSPAPLCERHCKLASHAEPATTRPSDPEMPILVAGTASYRWAPRSPPRSSRAIACWWSTAPATSSTFRPPSATSPRRPSAERMTRFAKMGTLHRRPDLGLLHIVRRSPGR